MFHEKGAGSCLSDELMDSLQIIKFSTVQSASPQLMLIREQRRSCSSEEIAFKSCCDGSLLGTEPIEVLGTEQALDPSSPEFRRTAALVQCCQVRQVCFGAQSPESAMFCRLHIVEEFTFLSRNARKMTARR